jgi:hypothetical protein
VLSERLVGTTILIVGRAEYEEYRQHHQRVGRVVSTAMMVGAALCGFAVALLWSFVIGALAAAIIVLIGLDAFLRWDRAQWIKRFPEAAFSGTWRRRYGVRDRP